MRKEAASGLWDAEEKAKDYRPQLMKALDDPDPNVVAYAAGALQAQGVKEAELVAARKRAFNAEGISDTARFLVSRNLVGRRALDEDPRGACSSTWRATPGTTPAASPTRTATTWSWPRRRSRRW